jgi:hypothetical protein
MRNDGTYGAVDVGIAKAGHVWLEPVNGDYHIYFIGSDGYRRRTKNGDIYFSPNSNEGPNTVYTQYAGYIWVTASFDDTYICGVGYDGKIFRVGVGWLGTEDHQ